MHFRDGGHTAIEFTDSKGTTRTIKPRGGVFTASDPDEIRVLRAFGLAEEAEAPTTTKKKASTKTRAAAGKPVGKVLVEETGEIDTRGPGAPADEPGVKEV